MMMYEVNIEVTGPSTDSRSHSATGENAQPQGVAVKCVHIAIRGA